MTDGSLEGKVADLRPELHLPAVPLSRCSAAMSSGCRLRDAPGGCNLPSSPVLPLSFSGHGKSETENAKQLAQDVGQMVTHPDKLADPHAWGRIMTELATTCNFGALVLTFVAAAYHAYGYVQYKNAAEQERHSRRDGVREH